MHTYFSELSLGTQNGPKLRALSRKPASLEARLEVFLLERPKGVVWVLPRIPFFAFSGSFSGPLFGALFHDFWAQNGPQNRATNGYKINFVFKFSFGAFSFRSLSSLGTLFGSLLGLLGPSWGVSRAKKCRHSNAKTTFLKVVFLASRSSTWLS